MSNVVCYAAGALLLALSWTDLRDRLLPNSLVAAFGALYVLHAWLIATQWAVFAQHLLTAFGCLALGACLHRAARVGGGDVKLASALVLWIGPHAALPVFALVSLSGLAIALIGIAMDRLAPSSAVTRWWSAKRGIPYGVALAIGGWCALLPRTFIIE